MSQNSVLIGVDWGTTSFRAYRLAADGGVLDRIEHPDGILSVPGGGFPATFDWLLGPWLANEPGVPVLMSGMVGSRQGWVECPYVPCPAGPEDLARGLVAAPAGSASAFIVPGVTTTGGGSGFPDVMRGEETQIAGEAAESAVYLLPGTHSKWAAVSGGRITRFATFMTGEVFAVLRQHSILGRLMAGDAHDAESFGRGLRQARSGTLLNDLFSARTLGLFGALAPAGIGAYLSGLLIGHEIAEAQGRFATGGTVTVIGSTALTPLYLDALAAHGIAARAGTADSAARGHFAIAAAAGLLGR